MDKFLGGFAVIVLILFAGFIGASSYVKNEIMQDRLLRTEQELQQTKTEYRGYQMGVKDSR